VGSKSGTAEQLRAELVPAMKYRTDYESYFKRYNKNER
jgi:hypothetical protein